MSGAYQPERHYKEKNKKKKKNAAQKLIGKLGQDTLAYLKLRRKCEYLHHTDLK